MRRYELSNEERNERANARIEDYVEDRASESTTRASLLCLGFTFDEIEDKLDMAAAEWARRSIMRGPSAETRQYEDSLRWLNDYFRR